MVKVALPTTVSPTRSYYLEEILELELIPGVKSHASLYNRVTQQVPDKENKLKFTRKLVEETTKTSLKAIHDGKPWSKIRGKIKVDGKEIILFLKLNNLV